MIEFSINGKPLTKQSFRNALEREFYEAIINQITERVCDAAGADANRVRIDVLGSTLEDLNFSISGPEEVVAKVRDAFAA